MQEFNLNTMHTPLGIFLESIILYFTPIGGINLCFMRIKNLSNFFVKLFSSHRSQSLKYFNVILYIIIIAHLMYSACVLKTLIHQFYLSVKIISLSVNPWHGSVKTSQLTNIKETLYHFANHLMLCGSDQLVCERILQQSARLDRSTVLFLYMSKCVSTLLCNCACSMSVL